MRVLLLLCALVALALPANADECVMTTSHPEITTCPLGGRDPTGSCLYIDNDLCQPECLFSVWWYFESNDVEGLQRHDENKDDTCGGRYIGDVIVT